MSSSPNYISFPIHLIPSIQENLQDFLFYGLKKYSYSIYIEDLYYVYKKVCYAFYTKTLPPSFNYHLTVLASMMDLCEESHRKGFSSDGLEFDPQDSIEACQNYGEKYPQFKADCIAFYRIKSALEFFELRYNNLDNILHTASIIDHQIDEWQSNNGKDAIVMLNVKIALDYLHNIKTDDEWMLLKCYLAFKSIQGTKAWAKTTKESICLRMIGARSKKLKNLMLRVPGCTEIYYKYSKRYHIDKLIAQLSAYKFLKSKLGDQHKRRIFFSTKLTSKALVEAIYYYEKCQSKESKIEISKETERQARAELNALRNRKS